MIRISTPLGRNDRSSTCSDARSELARNRGPTRENGRSPESKSSPWPTASSKILEPHPFLVYTSADSGHLDDQHESAHIMSPRPSSRSGQSWRSTDADPGAGTSAPAWRRSRGEDPQRRVRWRRPVIVLLALLLPALLGWLVWLVQQLRLPTPAHLEVVCAGYELNVQIPHNVQAKNSLKRLLRLANRK